MEGDGRVALGRDGQPKAAAQLDGRADDRLVLGVRVHVDDERLVDLDLVDLELLELGQRGVAGAEVVDRAPDAHCMERAEDLARALDVGDDLALGYLELEAVGWKLPAVEQPQDARRKVAVEQAVRREVHAHPHFQALAPPGRALRERGVEHLVREDLDQPGVLGQRHERLRTEEPELRMVPAHEGLDSVRSAVLQRQLGLVVDDELAAVDALSQLAGEHQAVDAVLVVGGGVELVQRAPLLCAVERDVGVPDHIVRMQALHRSRRDPDARAHLERDAADLEVRSEGGGDPFRRALQGLAVGPTGPNEGELVTAETREQLVRLEHGFEPGGDLLEQRVPVVVAERVVDGAEIVEVDEEDSDGRLRVAGIRPDLVEPLVEHGPVWQSGQVVVQGPMGVRDRLTSPERDGEHREEQQRNQPEALMRPRNDHRREREQEAARPRQECDVAAQKVADGLPAEQRDTQHREPVVQHEERRDGCQDRCQLRSCELAVLGLEKPQHGTGGRDRDCGLRGVEGQLHRSGAPDQIRHQTRSDIDRERCPRTKHDQHREREGRRDSHLLDMGAARNTDRQELAQHDERSEQPKLGVAEREPPVPDHRDRDRPHDRKREQTRHIRAKSRTRAALRRRLDHQVLRDLRL